MENDRFYLSLLGVSPGKIDQHDGVVNAAAGSSFSPGCFRLLRASIACTIEARWAMQEQKIESVL